MKKKILVSITILWILFLFIAGGSYIYFLNEFTLEPIHKILHLPPGYESMDGMKIAFFTDLHLLDTSKDQQKLRYIIQRINIEQPDIILYGGDLIATENLEIRMAPTWSIARLRKLQAKYGVFAVTGNHDWIHSAGKDLIKRMTQTGIQVLDNQSVIIEGKCNVIGIQDEDGPAGCRPELALKGIDPNLPTIALLHRPEYYTYFPHNVKIFFAGHTHGGQINLPWIKQKFLEHVNEGEFGELEYNYETGQKLFISSGIGTSWIRIRINCPPQIIFFTCRKSEDEKDVK